MLQMPVANAAAATSDIWPSIKLHLSKPWPRPAKRPKSVADSSQPAVTRPQVEVSPKVVEPSELQRWLAVVPAQALRPVPSGETHLTGNGLLPKQWPLGIIHSANPFPKPTYIQTSRSFSTFSLHNLASKPRASTPVLGMSQRRTLFGMASNSNSRQPLVHLETMANSNPANASAQNAFYSALLRANMPGIVVQRYSSGRFASNKACEETNEKALNLLMASQGGSSAANTNQFSREQLNDIVSHSVLRSTGQMSPDVAKYTSLTGTGVKQDPIRVMVDEPWRSVILKWAKFIIGYGLLAYFALVTIGMAVEMTGVLKRGQIGKDTQAKAEQQTVRFSDVHGCEEAKEELQELVAFLKDPEKFSSLGGKLPKGILLAGPPGTGKTLLARAVAGEAGVPFFYMSGSEFDEIYVGVGAKRMRELFATARSKAPAIIFLDELDAVGAKRSERDPTYVKQSLNQLLTELDGFSQDTGVIVLGATNFPQSLDKALTRPGRFDRSVEVPLPDVRGRMRILQHYMKSIKVDSDISPEYLARGTPGFSGAQLESLVNQAAVRASKNKASTVNMLDLEWAKDKIMMGAEKRSMFIQEKDKLMTAYHEAGHALVAVCTEGHMPVYKATIMPRGPSLGTTHYLPEMDKVSNTKAELTAQLDSALGGKVAEEIVYGPANVTSGCSSDLSNATQVAYSMITQYGMSESLGDIDFNRIYDKLSPVTRENIEREVKSTIDGAHARAYNILTTKRKELDLLANALVEYEVLTMDEIKRVIKGEKLPKLKALKSAPLKLPEIKIPPGVGAGSVSPLGGQSGAGGKVNGPPMPDETQEGKPASPPAVEGTIDDEAGSRGALEGAAGGRGGRRGRRGQTAPVEERNR